MSGDHLMIRLIRYRRYTAHEGYAVSEARMVRHATIANSIVESEPLGSDYGYRPFPLADNQWWPFEWQRIYSFRKPSKMVTKAFSNYLFKEKYNE